MSSNDNATRYFGRLIRYDDGTWSAQVFEPNSDGTRHVLNAHAGFFDHFSAARWAFFNGAERIAA